MSVPSLPSVKVWLGQELEVRGIDAMIYSHYILSILQQDNYEMDPDFDYMNLYRKDARGKFRGNKRGRYSWSSEDLKKTAVLRCLQSVTEQECGIEGLVEELCQKLQKLQDEQSKRENGNGNGKKTQVKKENQKSNAKEENRAMKYFEAFPPLHTDTKWNESFYRKNNKKKSPTFAEKLSKKDETKSQSASVSRHSNSPVDSTLQRRPKSLPNVSIRNGDNTEYTHEPQRNSQKHRKKTRNDKHTNKEAKQNKRNSPVKAERKEPKKIDLLKQQDVDTPCDSDAEDISWYVDPVMDVFSTTSERSKFETVYRSEGTSPVMCENTDDSTLEDAVSSITESLCKEIIDEMAVLDDLPLDGKREDFNHLEVFGDGLQNRNAKNFKCNTLPRIGSKGFGDAQRPLSFIMDDTLGFTLPDRNNEIEEEVESRSDDDSSQMKVLLGSKSHLADIWKYEKPKVTNPWNTESCSETALTDEKKSVASLTVFTGAHEHVEEDARSNRSFTSDSLSDSLLQICDHKHDHDHVKMSMALVACNPTHQQQHWSQADYSTNFMHYSSEDENGVAFVMHPTQDAYQSTGGLNCGYQPAQSSAKDVNNALWSTYDMQDSCVPPPKIVTWDCSQHGVGLSKFMKKTKFIEGGVYGSPYSSHNNSQLNSVCSSRTESPYDDSLRDLWDTHFHEESQLDSKLLHHAVITRQHISQLQRKSSCVSSISSSRRNSALDYSSDTGGAFCDDTGIDSPVFVNSRRNSSRFDFARSGNVEEDNSELHPGDTHQELFEEVMKETENILELTQSLKTACSVKNNEQESFEQKIRDAEEAEYEFIPWCPSTPKTTESLSDSESLCGSLTTIKPAITKPEPIRNLKSQPIGFGSSYDRHRNTISPHEQSRREFEDLLISPKTHFRPIRESFSSEDSPIARDENFNSEQYINTDKSNALTQIFDGLKYSTSTPVRSNAASKHRLSMDCTKRYLEKIGKWDISDAGYLSDGNQPKTLYPKRQSRYFQKEKAKEINNISTSFPTNFQQRTPPYLTGAEYMSEVFDVPENNKNLPCLCGKGTTDGLVNVVDIGQPCPRHARWFQTCARGDESDTANYGFSSGGEFDPTVNSDYDQQIFPYEDDVFVPHIEESTMPKKVIFSSDLEEKWLQESEEQTTNGHGYKKKARIKNRLQPKPCSFFLEGKCRKLDCRYSHDLSTITCRFWEESTCFKGDNCPFLHGYASDLASNVTIETEHAVPLESQPVKETPVQPVTTTKNEPSLIKKGIFALRKKPKFKGQSSSGGRQGKSPSSSPSKLATSSSQPIPVVKATERNNCRSLPINIKTKPR